MVIGHLDGVASLVGYIQPSDAFYTFHLTAGDDYEVGPYTVRFSAGQQNATLMVSTVEDNTTELSEYFKVVINSTDQPGRVEIGSPNTAFITVEDNEPGISYILTVQSLDIEIHL